MEKILALVEGHTETHFVKQTYGNSIVLRPFPNGDDVAIELIIESILDVMGTIGGGITKVLILLDREGRDISASDMRKMIGDAISETCRHCTVSVGVTDRHIENWILADEDRVRQQYGPADYAYPGDGFRGKGMFEKMIGGVSIGPLDRALVLKACSAVRAMGKSESLAALIDQVDFDWNWAKT